MALRLTIQPIHQQPSDDSPVAIVRNVEGLSSEIPVLWAPWSIPSEGGHQDHLLAKFRTSEEIVPEVEAMSQVLLRKDDPIGEENRVEWVQSTDSVLELEFTVILSLLARDLDQLGRPARICLGS